VDAEKDKARRKRPDVQPVDAETITALEARISDLRTLLAKAEERASDERSRCDRLIDSRDLNRERPCGAP
jgi:hypothetical protein